jgi:uroporphyrinogen-III synthase
VLVTRPHGQASRLSAALAEQGATPVEVPAIRIEPPESWEAVDAAIARGGFAWVVFTSANGVTAFFERLAAAGMDARWFDGSNVAAIGPETARTLERAGVKASLVPDEYVAEALVACLADERDLSCAHILLPRADIAREALQDGLRAAGAIVHSVVAYRTAPETASPALVAQLRAGQIDVVTFTSASTVRGIVQILGGDLMLLATPTIACIGPITAAAAAALGLRVDVVAEQYTIPGLVAALIDHFGATAPAQRRQRP